MSDVVSEIRKAVGITDEWVGCMCSDVSECCGSLPEALDEITRLQSELGELQQELDRTLTKLDLCVAGAKRDAEIHRNAYAELESELHSCQEEGLEEGIKIGRAELQSRLGEVRQIVEASINEIERAAIDSMKIAAQACVESIEQIEELVVESQEST